MPKDRELDRELDRDPSRDLSGDLNRDMDSGSSPSRDRGRVFVMAASPLDDSSNSRSAAAACCVTSHYVSRWSLEAVTDYLGVACGNNHSSTV